jgi:FAD/FMN-containing dehydrogenase
MGSSPAARVHVADQHERKVARIAAELRRLRGGPVSLRKKAVSHQVPKAGDLKYSDRHIDVSDLDQILAIDPDRRLCVAESGVTFVDLVQATLPYGLVPVVVPEFKTITVGGAVAGCSVESTSFRHGGFHDSCLEYEVITADGQVLTCRPEGPDPLLFQMMHGTFGTLGILSRLTFRLMPAQPFVHVTYERHPDLEAYQTAIERLSRSADVDFLDGIIHTPEEHVLSVGRFVREAPYHNRYDWLKVYHASTRRRSDDYLRTPDYFFRYDHGITQVHPRSFVGRLLLGKFMGSTEILRLAEHLRHFLPARRPNVIVDVFVPFTRVPAFFDWYRREIDFFPIWCVPYRPPRRYPWLSDDFHARTPDELFLDLAVYGLPQPRGKNYHVLFEQELLRLGGMKTLISHNYYSEEDFWCVFNRPNYERVKARVDPDNLFRDLYDKTCRASRGLER